MVSDPIGIAFDENGRMFVTSTARTGRDEIDIRAHSDWMVPSITFKDIEDKRAFYKRVLAPENSAQNQWLKDWNGDGSRDWRDLTFHKERLYRLEDTNGDGMADVSRNPGRLQRPRLGRCAWHPRVQGRSVPHRVA